MPCFAVTAAVTCTRQHSPYHSVWSQIPWAECYSPHRYRQKLLMPDSAAASFQLFLFSLLTKAQREVRDKGDEQDAYYASSKCFCTAGMPPRRPSSRVNNEPQTSPQCAERRHEPDHHFSAHSWRRKFGRKVRMKGKKRPGIPQNEPPILYHEVWRSLGYAMTSFAGFDDAPAKEVSQSK